jgi:hypothetical protein
MHRESVPKFQLGSKPTQKSSNLASKISFAADSRYQQLRWLLTSFCVLFSSLCAEQTSPSAEDTCPLGPRTSALTAGHREANGIGYNQGYSSLGLFLSDQFKDYYHPFFDFRAHAFNSGKLAGNIGGGVRTLAKNYPFVWGINGFYDIREAKHSTFHQVSAGIEALWPKWDIRINGYFPIGHKKQRYGIEFDGFSWNSALFVRRTEFAFTGGNIDLGYDLIRNDTYSLHGTLGGYYFAGKYAHTGGALLRFSSHITPYFSAEVQASCDTLFKGIIQGAVYLHLPMGKRFSFKQAKTSCNKLAALNQKVAEPVSRFEIIVTHSHKQRAVARDPETNLPLHFIFVDNTGASHDPDEQPQQSPFVGFVVTSTNGNGTIGSPYTSLHLAENNSNPGDIIYVFPGNNTSHRMDLGITLQDNQTLMGSSASLKVRTPFGKRVIPRQTHKSPNITNLFPSTNVVTLANNNTVKGLNIRGGATLHAIDGTNIQNAFLSQNHIADTLLGININGISGNVRIENNAIAAIEAISITKNITDPPFFNAQVSGNAIVEFFPNIASTISVELDGGENFINISSNKIDSTFGLTSSIHVNATGTSVNEITISNNVVTHTPKGIDVSLRNTTVNSLFVEGNAIANSLREGIAIATFDSATLATDVERNFIVNADSLRLFSRGISLHAHDTSSSNLRLLYNSSSTLKGNSAGYLLFTDPNGLITLQSMDGTFHGVVGFNEGSQGLFGLIDRVGHINVTPLSNLQN